jgi:DNA-binding CsgD family transcriptional regulator
MPTDAADLPAELRAWIVNDDATVAVVTFSLARCASLTNAEREVARMAGAGMSNLAIARRRRTSVRTVANQIASVLRKLGIPSRAALATIPEFFA